MSEKKVVMYSQPTCGVCHTAKSYLESKGVEVEDLDVTTDTEARRALVEDLKSQATPTLVIGEEVLIGFDPAKIDAALEKAP